MWNFLRMGGRFAGDQRGNVAIVFAFASVPLVGLLSGAVDISRQSRYKAEIINAMDAAAIALVRRGARNDADADQFVNVFISTMLPADRDPMLHLSTFDATKIEGGYRVSSDGFMDTALMTVVGIEELPLDLKSEVISSSGTFEVALALDNTGSMARLGRIQALRSSAGVLVDQLYSDRDAQERVKMALIPFVTAVNVKTKDVFQRSWIEPTGDPLIFGTNFSAPSDRLDLFAGMRVEWKGCVEARKAPYDEDDTLPDSTDTRWVPYLWPDEPDNRGYGNDYLRDTGSGNDWNRLRDVAKYRVRSGVNVTDTTSRGPNAACPRPIVELTNDTARMHHEIDRMVPHNTSGGNNSGTNVAQGLLWGWHVLSPDEPYSQGVAYSDEDTTKVLILLSDGRNQVVDNNDVTESDYTSYGYLAAGRMGSTNDYTVAERAVDAKVKRICESIKGTGIRVYTILFQVDFERTKEIFRNCASKDEEGKPLYYYIPAASELETAFRDIGKDLTSIYVSR